MNSLHTGSCWRNNWAAPALAIAVVALAAATPRAQEFAADAGWRDVSVAEYRQHLEDLDALVAGCQKQRGESAGQKNGAKQSQAEKQGSTQISFSACDPAQIGPDDRVLWSAGAKTERREVRYDWLRLVLGRAARKDGAAQMSLSGEMTGAEKTTVTVAALLTEARQRLQDDAKQAGGTAEANPNYDGERQSLKAILAQKAYEGVGEISARERFVEWFDNLLDAFFASLVRFGSRVPWIAWVLRVLLLAGIAAALIWLLLRIEQRSRVRLIPDFVAAPGAPSAREWQLWLKDAQAMAAKGLWREAIHFLYWAAIARLESRRLWPADRARTPREYLALLAGGDPRKPSLTNLTREFERTWYGGRAAAASDYKAAMEQAAALGVAME